jgi:hypothetical protein
LTSLWLGLAGAAAQEVAPPVIDPLFGLEVPQGGPGFERADPALLRRCTIGPPGSEQQSWVFASTRTSSGTFLALGGLSRMVRDGVAGPWRQNSKGELVRLAGNACDVIDPPREALMYPDDAAVPLGAEMVRGMAADAVVRYSRAFGSRAAFTEALRAQNAWPDAPRLQLFRDAIAASPLP